MGNCGCTSLQKIEPPTIHVESPYMNEYDVKLVSTKSLSLNQQKYQLLNFRVLQNELIKNQYFKEANIIQIKACDYSNYLFHIIKIQQMKNYWCFEVICSNDNIMVSKIDYCMKAKPLRYFNTRKLNFMDSEIEKKINSKPNLDETIQFRNHLIVVHNFGYMYLKVVLQQILLNIPKQQKQCILFIFNFHCQVFECKSVNQNIINDIMLIIEENDMNQNQIIINYDNVKTASSTYMEDSITFGSKPIQSYLKKKTNRQSSQSITSPLKYFRRKIDKQQSAPPYNTNQDQQAAGCNKAESDSNSNEINLRVKKIEDDITIEDLDNTHQPQNQINTTNIKLDQLLYQINKKIMFESATVIGPTWVNKLSQKYNTFSRIHTGIIFLTGCQFIENDYQILDLNNQSADSYQECDQYEFTYAVKKYQMYRLSVEQNEMILSNTLIPVSIQGCCGVMRQHQVDILQTEKLKNSNQLDFCKQQMQFLKSQQYFKDNNIQEKAITSSSDSSFDQGMPRDLIQSKIVQMQH